MLEEARTRGLTHVELTTASDSVPSQCVIEANGGKLTERFTREPQLRASEALRYRIDLRPSARSLA